MSQDHGTPLLKHGMADINPVLRPHYVTAGDGNRIIVLVHGFPQSWWTWRRVIPILANAGFRVIAPDYRGAGNSSRPIGGYDKRTMANDIHLLLHVMREVADHVTGFGVSNTGHWIAEENPEAFTAALLRFLTGTDTK
jgi:pimeloyl-ACP methyl ester carboxylesterase